MRCPDAEIHEPVAMYSVVKYRHVHMLSMAFDQYNLAYSIKHDDHPINPVWKFRVCGKSYEQIKQIADKSGWLGRTYLATYLLRTGKIGSFEVADCDYGKEWALTRAVAHLCWKNPKWKRKNSPRFEYELVKARKHPFIECIGLKKEPVEPK
jgi:hypothetical protein